MLRSIVYPHDDIKLGDTVTIWRDGSGCLYPTCVTKVTPCYYEVVHNGRLKSSGLNRTRLLYTNSDDKRYSDMNRYITSPNDRAVDEWAQTDDIPADFDNDDDELYDSTATRAFHPLPA